jgi:hypothetical protein
MDKVRECLAIACLAYQNGDADFAIRSFLQGMEEANGNGEQGLQQVVEFLRAPVAKMVADVPAAENTLAPALHSDNETKPAENKIDVQAPVDPQPVVSPIPEPVPSTITSLSSMLVDDGDEELEARAEAEGEIDEDDLDDEDEEEDEESSDDSEEEDEEMQLSISASTPLRLKQE